MSLTIQDGGLITIDPSDTPVFEVDWSEVFASTVSLLTSSWTISVVRGTSGLIYDNPTRSGQSTFLRLSNGVLGSLYQVANTVQTNEIPAQTKERSFLVLIENL